jgi:hypothetical protein
MATPTPINRAPGFRPEPALIVNFVAAVATMLAAFVPDRITPESAALWVVVINAVGALVIGLRVRPLAPSLFTNVVGAVASLLAAYRFEVSSEQVGLINTVVLLGLALFVRGQSTPVQDRVPV